MCVERIGGHEVRSSHDWAGERIELATSLGTRMLISRDSLGRPQRLYLGADAERHHWADIAFAHTPLGSLRSLYFASGLEVAWKHDLADRPLTRTLALHRGGAPERLERREYAWRGEEQLVGVATLGKQARQYDRDARGCVVREIVDDATIIRAIDVADNVYRTASGQDRHYGPGGRLEQVDGHRVEHDEDGNLTLRADSRGEWRYSWNGHGLLSAVERPDGARVEFEYDGLARRIARRLVGHDGAIEHEVAFVWDGHTVVHELDSEVGLISWFWLPESATPILKMQGERRWSVASDHLGAPTHLHDENGAVVWAANLDIFGRVRVELGEVRDCPWRWPGQYEDGLLDEFYNRWRYYSPTLGRFISQDPAGPIAGLNPYAYVDDPTLWIDLLGLTGAYIFSFATGKMYIGKGPLERALVSQRERTVPGDRISKGAHLDCGDNRMAFMVEAVLMERNKFSRNPDLLNEINSPGKKLLKAATPAEITAVTKLADALEDAYTESQGKICR